ncbi:T9SS type A sorting domain-containing protein [Longibacter sp.]|uniref:T9SS type A sorting domain-containing protein n=1 Tax=Longibacter sp. TaxID=2045415 RepID=UPI003EBED2F8
MSYVVRSTRLLLLALFLLSWAALAGTAPASGQTVFTVNSSTDATETAGCTAASGTCSLRGAIEEANATPNVDASTPDRIEFDIPGAGPHVIEAGTQSFNDPLPTITESVVIDGTTEPDFDTSTGTPSVAVDASEAFGGAFIVSGHSASSIRGIAMFDADDTQDDLLVLREGTNHTIAENWLGVHPNGTVSGGNNGVVLEDVSGALIEQNRIQGMGAVGVLVLEDGGTATGNRITQNAIFDNAFAAIDLGDDGITPNDGASDGDTGPNTLLNKPVLRSTSYDGSTLTIDYEVPVSTMAAPYPLTVEFFAADASGQPETYLGSDSYDGGTETTSFSVSSLSPGAEIVATATDGNGNTSEVGILLPAAASTYTVTSTGSVGPGTLRRAIRAANNDGAASTIAFDISGAAPHTIQPSTPLPKLYGPVVVDATTEPDYAVGTPAVVIDGGNIDFQYGWGLKIEAGGTSAVRGLSIVNVKTGDFSGVGLFLVDTDFRRLSSDTFDITSNFLGVLPDGTTAAPNWNGMVIGTWSTTVGGATASERNVVSGNENHGIDIGPGVAGATISGNYVGTSASGTEVLGNGDDGVHLSNTGVASAEPIVIGGSASGEGNVIAANGDDGIHLHADNVNVYGNRIGLDVDDDPMGNADEGISAYYGASDNRIGGIGSGEANTIAHNGANGVFIPYNGSAFAFRTAIRGNAIFQNDALGIALGGEDGLGQDGDGISRNDAVPEALSGLFSYESDEDEGANQQQNTPVISSSSVDLSAGTLTVTYSVPSDPAHSTYPLAVDFYEAVFDVGGVVRSNPFGANGQASARDGMGKRSGPPAKGDARKSTGYDAPGEIGITESIVIPVSEGALYLGSDTYTESDYSAGAKTVTVPLAQMPGSSDISVNGTATDAEGNTSEFSFPVYLYEWAAGGSISASKNGGPPAWRFSTYDLTIDPSYTEQAWEVGVTRTLAPPSGTLPSNRELATYGSWTVRTADPSVDFEVEACFRLAALTNPESDIDFSRLELWRRPVAGSSWSDVSNRSGVTVTVTNDFGGPEACATGLNVMGEFIVAADPSALPVELAGFSAIPEGDDVRLSWSTLSESGNDRFVIERRVDDGSWTDQAAVVGQGTTSSSTDYTWNDRSVPFEASTLTYRLRQVDVDGSTSRSAPTTVHLNRSAALTLEGPRPNPARGTVSIPFAVPEDGATRLAVYDVLGREVAVLIDGSRAPDRYVETFDASPLASGVYFLRLSTEQGTRTARFTVVR